MPLLVLQEDPRPHSQVSVCFFNAPYSHFHIFLGVQARSIILGQDCSFARLFIHQGEKSQGAQCLA